MRAVAAASPSPSSWVQCGGRVSYAAQRPWIMHGTVRDNVLFGEPFDAARYEAALEACALRTDLEAFDGGDLTEVGEKGVQLSGGQAQRLSLCRAVYARSEVVFLDDVLSAVDAHVARHILTECLAGPLLRGRTVILVTHQVALTLPVADQVVVVGEGGRVALQGRPKEGKSPEMAAFLAQHSVVCEAAGDGDEERRNHQEQDAAEGGGGAGGATSLIRKDGEGKKVVGAEQKGEGRIKLRVYAAYMAASGGALLALLSLATFAGAEALNVFQSRALGEWVDRLQQGDDGDGDAAGSGAVPYLALSGASVLVLVLQSLLTSFCSLLASRRIHHAMAHRVMRAPMHFFEVTPVGRLQNRFASDMDTIDTDLMDTTTKFISRLAAILTITVRRLARHACINKCVVPPLSHPFTHPVPIYTHGNKNTQAVIVSAMAPLILGILPVLLASAYVGWAYQRSAQELKRLDSVTRSPIYSHFAESVAGLATIRAYRRRAAFVAESGRRVDANDRAYHHLWSANRWLALRLQLLGSAVTGWVTTRWSVQRPRSHNHGSCPTLYNNYTNSMVGAYILATLGKVPGPTAGLVLLFCMNFSDNANTLIRQQVRPSVFLASAPFYCVCVHLLTTGPSSHAFPFTRTSTRASLTGADGDGLQLRGAERRRVHRGAGAGGAAHRP